MRVLKFVAVLIGIFIGVQFIRPELANPAVTADLAAPPEVKQILRTSCYDCHSNETRLRWFDRLVPAYWMVVRDVKAGRKHLNFSEFATLPPAQQKGELFEAVNMIRFGAMPLKAYERVHPESKVSPQQMRTLEQYLLDSLPGVVPTSSAANDASGKHAPSVVDPALNGITYFSDYKNWKTVNSTDRFDNQTVRQILGNDVAISAIAAGQTNPWPDGTAFAKVAWNRHVDEQGAVTAGDFKQVEFMIRDSRKYSSTLGWGFARWVTPDLKPYGKDAGFAGECVGCHTLMRDHDYVYTTPIQRHSTTLPFDPLQWRVITASVDRQASSMSTLYGNDVAVDAARARLPGGYPAGSVLSLVTWHQQDDDHWFGAKIPAAPATVEFVMVGKTGSELSYGYKLYEGTQLTETTVKEGGSAHDRIAYILSQTAAAMP